MTNAALQGKPDAENPHVAPSQRYGGTSRFDEGEVASAATPRRGSLLYKKLMRIVLVVSLFINVGAIYLLVQWIRNAVDIQRHILALAENANTGVVASEYKVRYADDAFAFACTTNGSYVFHSLIDDMPVTFSFERKGSKPVLANSHRCMVSSCGFFASWHFGGDKCDHVVFQYNDIGRKDDPEGNWEIRGSETDRRLFFAENGYPKSQSSSRRLDTVSDEDVLFNATSGGAGLTDSSK